MWIFCSGALGKGKLFWFFSVGFVCWQKPNVLDRALAFYTDAQRFGAWRSGGFTAQMFNRSTTVCCSTKVQ